MRNYANYGILRGVLKENPIISENKDNSKKVLLTIIENNSVFDNNGQGTPNSIQCEGYIPASKAKYNAGPYSILQKGDEVSIEYDLRNKTWTTPSGTTMSTFVPQINTIQFNATQNQENRELRQLKAQLASHHVKSLAELIHKIEKKSANNHAVDETEIFFTDEDINF